MKCYVDSREKDDAIRTILSYFDRHGIEWERVKLDTGDYMLDGQPGLVVDRKRTLNELSSNLLSPDRARFYREVRRARENGIRLIILCEHGSGIKTVEDVKGWTNRYGKTTGRKLADAIFRLEIGYGVETYFCDKRSTGRRIIELLGGEVK